MKKPLNNWLQTFLMLLLIGIIFSSCEAERSFAKDDKTIVKRCSMKDANLQSDIKLKKAVIQLKIVKANCLQSNANARLVYDEKSGLYYDDEKGIYVSKDGKESYTFPIFQPDPNEKVKNITFNKMDNNEYDVYIVYYDYSKEDTKIYSKELLAEHEIKYEPLVKDGITYSEDRKWLICYDKISTTWEEDGSYQDANGDIIQHYCGTVTISRDCESGGSLGPEYEHIAGSGSSSGGGGDGGSSGGGGDGSDVITSPNTPAPTTPNDDDQDNTSILTAAVIDMDGNSIPCPGDPVKNPKICPSSPGNPAGGTFGCTRNNPARKCDGYDGKKKHAGLDIQGKVDDKIYNMHSGKIVDSRKTFGKTEYKKDSLGNYVVIESVINGQTVRIKYCHMGNVQFEVGKSVAQGTCIGTIGRSGNAGSPGVTTHLHIQSQVKDGNIWTVSNPINYLNTQYNSTNFEIETTCN